MHYFLNIGSNLGCRELNITRAVREIEKLYGYFELSKKVESEPWGFDSPNSFINVAMMIITEDSPREVLARLKEIEQRISPRSHRKSDGSYADRVIDIDIMAIDELIIDEEGLKVPHPHLAERDFFIRPFLELAPGWRDPRTGLTLPELAEKL
jgi:2-amino-4-hydroxy-6-hydroxymethyldihydropteridine diphosphokinase